MNDELRNILEKIRVLYKKYGIKSVTMDDLSRELGISKKTLYQYVKDKSELVEMVADLEMDSTCEHFKQICAQELNAIEQLFEVQKMINLIIKNHNPSEEYDLKKYYPDVYKKILNIRRERMYTNVFENIRKGKSEGLYRENLREEIIAKSYVMRMENAVDSEVFTPEEKASPDVFFEMFVYHIRGIATDKGIKVLEEKLKELEMNNVQKI